MFEKVNPSHPDKIADRIAGAIVDIAYSKEANPKIAVEVLIGHGLCQVIVESSVEITHSDVDSVVHRIAGDNIITHLLCVPQDAHLADNQNCECRCGDNGIFKGVPVTDEERKLTLIAQDIYLHYPTDGKYILDNNLIICQSHANSEELKTVFPNAIINPLGEWTGGIDVDTGATNRKLGSDMGASVTGGGLHGKDLSKSDVSINIYLWLKAQREKRTVEASCSIGDTIVDGKPYKEIVEIAKQYIRKIGGFEKFAEWGLIRCNQRNFNDMN